MSYKTEDLVNQLRNAREGLRISQRELSARTGITQSHISQIESGKLTPGVGTLIDIGRALDMEVVLVPKRLLPAVESVVQGVPSRKGLSPEAGKSVLKVIERGEKRVHEQKQTFGASAELDRIAETLRFFKLVSLRPEEVEAISAVIETLSRQPVESRAREILRPAVQRLLELRNKIAHSEPNEPRGAYSFDDDGDDDA